MRTHWEFRLTDNCFGLSLVKVAHILEGLGTNTLLGQAMTLPPSTVYTKMTFGKHLKDTLLTVMNSATRSSGRWRFSLGASLPFLVPPSVSPVTLLNFLLWYFTTGL